MPVTAAATPLCWTPRPWRKNRRWRIPAAAFSTRYRTDGAVNPGADRGRRRRRAYLRWPGLPGRGGAKIQPLANTARRDRQLSLAPPRVCRTGIGFAAARGIDPGREVVVGLCARLDRARGDGAVGFVRDCVGDQPVPRSHHDRLRLRPVFPETDAELEFDRAQRRAGGAAAAIAWRGGGVHAHTGGRLQRRSGLRAAVPDRQYHFRLAPPRMKRTLRCFQS